MLLLLFMPFIFVDIYIAAQTFQKNKTNLDSNDILTKLLELHQYHCGEAATCGSSEHVELSEFRIPVPCCIPCSCLSSCVEQQNCCPVSVNGTLTEPTTTSGLDDIVQENETNKTDDGLIFDRKGVVSWKKTDENDEKGENKTKLHKLDELRIANSTGLTTKDSEVLKFNDIYKAHEKCIRPQLLYRPNRHLDSQAYMMVVTCPHGFKNKLIIDKCNAGMDDVELLDMIPVTSKLSGLTYKNKHCLMCNEKLQAKYIMEWTAEIVSYSAIRRSIFFPNLDSLMNTLKRIKTDFCNIHFMPGDESLARTCKAYDIIFCNQTGLWDIYNESVEAVCLHGSQLPITGRINEGLFTFKNIGCLHCNTGSDLSKGALSCGYWETESSAASSFSLTLNLRKIIPDSKKDKPVPAPYIDHDVLQQLQHRRCPAGKLNLLVSTCICTM